MLIALLVFLLCLRPFGVLGPWACWAGAPLLFFGSRVFCLGPSRKYHVFM